MDARNEECREASLFRADGVVKHDANPHFETCHRNLTTPSAPAAEASRNCFDVASTPPLQGEYLPTIAVRAGLDLQLRDPREQATRRPLTAPSFRFLRLQLPAQE